MKVLKQRPEIRNSLSLACTQRPSHVLLLDLLIARLRVMAVMVGEVIGNLLLDLLIIRLELVLIVMFGEGVVHSFGT